MPAIGDVKKIIQELIVPELKEIKAELREIRVEIKRLDEKIDLVYRELSQRIDSLHSEMLTEIKRLDEKIDIAIQIRERLAALESKVAALTR